MGGGLFFKEAGRWVGIGVCGLVVRKRGGYGTSAWLLSRAAP